MIENNRYFGGKKSSLRQMLNEFRFITLIYGAWENAHEVSDANGQNHNIQKKNRTNSKLENISVFNFLILGLLSKASWKMVVCFIFFSWELKISLFSFVASFKMVQL